MKNPLRRLTGALLAGVLTVGLTVTTAAPAAAITGGKDAGPLYPNVGLIAFYDSTGSRFRCSATLVSPTVLLTAGHCTDGTVGSTAVTFQTRIAEVPPSGLPTATDPAQGYTDADIAAVPGYVSGTASTHPDYSGFTDLDNWNDVGVIVLDAALPLPTSPIADVGTLDAIPQARFVKTLFTAVGYGTEVRKPAEGPQKPTPMSFPLRRQYAEMPGQKLTPQVFQTNGNPNDPRGDGGTCFGDSGGPVFLGAEIVGVTSYTYTSNCRYLGGYQRVDIAVVQDWLNTYFTL